MAFPLQGARTARNGARMKAEGMRAGTADLFLAVPKKNYCGLWVEMKTSTGKLTDSQKAFKDFVQSSYAHFVCRSFDEVRKTIEWYLSDRQTSTASP